MRFCLSSYELYPLNPYSQAEDSKGKNSQDIYLPTLPVMDEQYMYLNKLQSISQRHTQQDININAIKLCKTTNKLGMKIYVS